MNTLTHGVLKRALSVVLVLVMLLSMGIVGLTSASAAEVEVAETGSFSGGSKIYLKGNSNWATDNARSALYVFNDSSNTNAWVSMTQLENEDYIYEATIPTGTWEGMIFCRMNGATTENNWENRWNQTADVKDYDGTKDLYIVSGTLDNMSYSWSTYFPDTVDDTGSNTATIYVNLNGNTTFSSSSYLYVWKYGTTTSIGAAWPGVQLDGPNEDGYYYRTFSYDTSYGFIINNGSNQAQTADSAEYTASKLLVTLDSGAVVTYADPEVIEEGGGTTTDAAYWVDVDGDVSTKTDIIYPKDNTLYLPSGVDRSKVTLVTSDDATFTVNGTEVTSAGATVDLSNSSYTLTGDFTNTITIMQSKNVPAMFTVTDTAVPQGTYQGYPTKDDYESSNVAEEDAEGNVISNSQYITVVDEDGNVTLDNKVLKKIKGRGNSSWEASHKIIGKYAFNITLDKKADLVGSGKSKKYCLVSFNADEARMRNMVVYDLAAEIGVQFIAEFTPVDFYNNGCYIGSYLLTDKVEIGEPLVALDVNLDDENDLIFGDAYGDDAYRASTNGSFTTQTGAGYMKYYDYSSLGVDVAESVYADSGFLLEFELYERFDDEMSGFISTKGQQIVSKYPEYATKAQIEFIANKWNTAEALMYDDTATYEELDAVIDVESFARMYLIQELTKNLDGGATSYYVYYDGGKFHAGVAWDYDWTLGQYAKKYTDRVNTSSDFNDQVNADPSAYGGWYLNSKTIYGASDFNVQAALCQNDNFWSVVVAEWNELFYDVASTYTTNSGSITSVSQLGGKIADYYEMVKYSTAMDEDKWGLIASNPLSGWGSTDTGDNHDAATIWLSNWYYNRLNWMYKYIDVNGSSASTYGTDYDIQPPSVTADKDTYAMGETVTLTIEDKTGGYYTYTIYKDGEEVGTSDDGTYTFTSNAQGTANYTAIATSTVSGKSSESSDPAVITVEGFSLTLDVEAPTSVGYNDKHSIKATTNADDVYDVTYKLYWVSDNVDIDKTDKASETVNGLFENIYWDQTAIDYTATWKVVASVTIDGETYTAEKTVEILITGYDFEVTLNAPQTVEAGLNIILSASAPLDTESTVIYSFYNAETDELIGSNTTGVLTIPVTNSDIGSTFSYYVTAEATIIDFNGSAETFSKTSATKTVSVIAVSEVYTVTIYFKSTSTLGYKPLITTTGALDDYTDYEMVKDTFICQNASQTASYWWYKAEVEVSKASPNIDISILSSRYAMEGDITLTITESGDVYLGVDNLNEGDVMVNMTKWDEDLRNYTVNALHMVYDSEYDSDEALATVAAYINLRSVGDADNDGKLTVKDATLVQKHLAGLAQLDTLSVEVADLNSDNVLTIKDATAIQKRVAYL